LGSTGQGDAHDPELRAHDAADAAVLESLQDGAKEALDLLTAWRAKSTGELG
jgi:hypothetical protein